MHKTNHLANVLLILLTITLALAPSAAAQAAPDAPNAPDAPLGVVYYVNSAVTTNLAGYWPFDPIIPANVKDASGNANHGAINGNVIASGAAPTLFPNSRGRQFDGAGDFVSVADANSLDLTDQMTLSLWVYLNNTNLQYVLSKVPFPNNSGYALAVNAGQLLGQVWDSATTAHSVQGGAINVTTWTHLAVTFQRNGSMVAYVNGTAVDTVAAGGNPIGVNANILTIGASSWSTNSYEVNGRIDDVRVYNRALTAGEITLLAAGKCPQAGTSWATAFNTIQCALPLTVSTDEIWVVQGSYKPSLDGDPSIPYTLKAGVSLYGGFIGTETLRTERSAFLHQTLLDGDLNGDDGANFTNRSDNSARVVVASAATAATVLDGFIIRGGYARSSVPTSNDDGGGLYSLNGKPTLSNLVFIDNQATAWGGGAYIAGLTASQIVISNVQFVRNKAQAGGGLYLGEVPQYQISDVLFVENQGFYGGGLKIYHYNTFSGSFTRASFKGNSSTVEGGAVDITGGAPTFISSIFSGNHSVDGGAIYATDSGYRMFNVAMSGNYASANGGAYYNVNTNPIVNNPSPWYHNSILWGNTGPTQFFTDQSIAYFKQSLVQGGCPSAPPATYCLGTIFTTDPLFFQNPSDGGDGWGVGNNDNYGSLRPQPTSPAIDVGDNNADIDWLTGGTQPVPSPDLDGQVRYYDSATSSATGLGTPPFIDLGAFEANFYFLYAPILRR